MAWWIVKMLKSRRDVKPLSSQAGNAGQVRKGQEMISKFGELHRNSELLGTVSEFINEFIAAVKPLRYFDEFIHGVTVPLTAYFECFGVPRESALLAEGEPGDFLIIFPTGAAVSRCDSGVQRRILAEIGPGLTVGEITSFDGLPRTASCLTSEPCDLSALSRERFPDLQAAPPRLANKFLLFVLQQNVARLRAMTQAFTRVVV